MTMKQEEALYHFLEANTDIFTIDDAVFFLRMADSHRVKHLGQEILTMINTRNLAFHVGKKTFISRRGCFEPVRFVINPSRLELVNGILIPGHRCIPFANPALLPQEYTFTWKSKPIPASSTEGPPEDFYPYYSLFGEEYAPQYIANDNPENEKAYSVDPWEDPPEVSVHTLDMRKIYREAGFVPGDFFVVKTLDWKAGKFALEKMQAGVWAQRDLYDWFEIAEAAFHTVFELKGPCSSTEEQISYAYWYGGKRMRELPAYSMEDFLYNRTEHIESVPYGIETRFWYAGKEIPDQVHYYADQNPPDRTDVEEVLFRHGLPISEYVALSYIRDAVYRGETEADAVFGRIIPQPIAMDLNRDEKKFLMSYIEEVFDEFSKHPVERTGAADARQRVGELHTAVVDLMARLRKNEMDSSWYPKHTFVILSQIQGHAASLLEELGDDSFSSETELDAIENSLDSMIDTYQDIRDLVQESMENFRRNNLSLVKTDEKSELTLSIQASLGGVDVWRRLIMPGRYTLKDLHRALQILFDWKDSSPHSFRAAGKTSGNIYSENRRLLEDSLSLRELQDRGIMEIEYEYGALWNIRLLFLFHHAAPGGEAEVRCTAGEGAAPPEKVGGPLRFRRFVSAFAQGNDPEKRLAEEELGKDFDPDQIDIDGYNRRIGEAFRAR
jgi:hypothetical protein